MKKTLFVACIISLLSASLLNAKAPDTKDYTNVIRGFIDSHMNSDVEKFKAIMDEHATVKIPRGEKVLVQEKDDLAGNMKKDAGTQQNCSSNYEVLAKSDALVIARVDFNYENCIQHQYLIIEKNVSKDWKITQVCKMFDDVKIPENGSNSIAAKN
ncbi:hypothetical protein [Mucilaginibacter celer]|uniref:Nuclear transport factor 2 family protein n=1 Tax=Mucilaginibacter celer TaxID=2305508 RepID=A0A494VST3_9SPHI|nr:hypothetical protein [Mucilaginibacter celer]AYL96460.1 hypothetical protein HYN43_014645 [Mucilaginibacter celer]